MRVAITLAVVLLLPTAGVTQAALPQGPSGPQRAEISREQIEADWVRQEQVRNLPAGPATTPYRTPRMTPYVVLPTGPSGNVRPEEDAAGGVDGIKKAGGWGFCTNKEPKPWWQVQLNGEMSLDRVLIYNTDTKGNVELCRDLLLLVSSDGKTWNEVYRHNGQLFAGPKQPVTVPLKGVKARYVRVQLPRTEYLILDEIEVYAADKSTNVALGRPAIQSSASPYSRRHVDPVVARAATGRAPATGTARPAAWPVPKLVESGLRLAESLRRLGGEVDAQAQILQRVADRWKELPKGTSDDAKRVLYLEGRWAVRRLAFANPLLDFRDLLFVKRAPTKYPVNCDQYLGWWSQPGGGLYLLKDFKSQSPTLVCLTAGLPPGNILDPDLSYDGTKALFAYCRYYPGLSENPNKLDKTQIPEDAFYKLYEVNLDGTGLRRLIGGKYDDFGGRYLPDGQIVFLSTRRGQRVQCTKASAAATVSTALPDCFVRCGGGPERPCSVHTLHLMDANGEDLRPLSAFEMFEYTPNVDQFGRILYARWDYVDRHRVPCISLWSTLPDGSNAQEVFGNYLPRNPHCIFEARSIPNSRKLVFTASAHHGATAGSLVLLDPNRGTNNESAMTRLTPEVPFPESEAVPATYFANPYPLSEDHYLVAWSDQPLAVQYSAPAQNAVNALGLYLFDRFGNLELIYRDPAISSCNPLPVHPRKRPAPFPDHVAWEGDQVAEILLLDVYRGLEWIPRGTVRRLRIVGIPSKTHPTMNHPSLGVTGDDPGKFVIGTAAVEPDGSAHFRVPSGVPFFVQALDADGLAVQTMRSATYLPPGKTFTCIGCHESRTTAPPNAPATAARRAPSRLTPGPEGSWPLDFQVLVQPVLDKHCLDCHRAGGKDAAHDLSAGKAYDTLVNYGKPSLRQHVLNRYEQLTPSYGPCAAQVSPLLRLLKQGHYDAKLSEDDWDRLVTWIDTYGQRRGAFSPAQEDDLRELRRRMASLLEK